MEKDEATLNKSSSLSELDKLYISFNEKYDANLMKSTSQQKSIRDKLLFADLTNSTKCLPQTNLCHSNSNLPTDLSIMLKNKIPLPVIIRHMLDETFGKLNSKIDVNKHRFNFEDKNNKEYFPPISTIEESINSHDETNGCSTLHESVFDRTEYKDNKLITIEEESKDSLYHSDSIDCTGIYLNKLLKFNDKFVDRVRHDNPLLSQNDTEVYTSQNDTEFSVNDASCGTNFVNNESSIYQNNSDGKNESVLKINTINSFDDGDCSNDDEKTADFFNILDENNVETKQVSCKSLSLSGKDRTKSSIDTSSVDFDCSVKDKPKFINMVTLNLKGSSKRTRQSITFSRYTTLCKCTPKLSLNTNSELAKRPCYNTALRKKQVEYRNISSTKTKNTPKVPKIHSHQAKPFKSHEMPTERQTFIPQIILIPATPTQVA